MDEIAKAEARNYAAMAGFLLLGVFAMIHLLVDCESFLVTGNITHLVLGGLLIVLSIFLAVLGKRGLTTIFFFTEGMLLLIGALVENVGQITLVLVGVNVVLAILMLFSKDGKKIVYFLLALLAVLVSLGLLFAWPAIVCTIIFIIQCVLYAWCALCCAAERTGFPGRNLICEDEAIDFKTSGSVLGYLMLAMVCAVWFIYYLFSENVLPLVTVEAVTLLAGFMLILIGIMLFAIAKMRFTPMVFILVGAMFAVSTMVVGAAMFVFGGAFILLGIFALLRNESRVLLALFLIIYGLTFFISVLITGNYSLGIFHAIINLIPGLVALYLGFAVFVQNKKLLI